MRKTSVHLVIVGAFIVCTGCASLQHPKVQGVHVRVDGIDFKGVNLVFDVDVLNTYPIAIRTPKFRYGIDIAGTEFIKSEDTVKIDLPARATGTMHLPARFEYLKLWQTYNNLANADEVDYALHGTIMASALQQSFEIPLEHKGRFPVLRPPSFSGASVDFSDLSMNNAKVIVNTDIHNPNAFSLGLQNLNFHIKLGNVDVGNIGAATINDLVAKQTGKLSLSGEITAQTALLQLLQKKSLGQPSITYSGALHTPYGDIPIQR